jgi:hypothetical protein
MAVVLGATKASAASALLSVPVMESPAASVMKELGISIPSSSRSSTWISYRNLSVLVPDPLAYVAWTGLAPTRSPMDGDPATETAVENVAVSSTMSPTAYVPLLLAARLVTPISLMTTPSTVGAVSVSVASLSLASAIDPPLRLICPMVTWPAVPVELTLIGRLAVVKVRVSLLVDA